MDIRSAWAQLSIRSKALVWLGTVTLLMLTMMSISASMRNHVMAELTRRLEAMGLEIPMVGIKGSDDLVGKMRALL